MKIEKQVSVLRSNIVCAFEECLSEREVRDYCRSHYQKLYREGKLVVKTPLRKKPRICGVCKNFFLPTNNKQRYCGLSCGSTARNPQHRAIRECLGCGTPFKPSQGGTNGKATYCSRACKSDHRMPTIEHGPPEPKICVECGEGFIGTRTKYCSKRCSDRMKHRTADVVRRTRINAGPKDRIGLGTLYKRDRAICCLCFGHVEKKDWSMDHVLALANGGTHTWDNVKLAHHSCNNKKWKHLDWERIDYGS